MVGSPKLFNEFSISLPTGFFSFKKFYPPSFSLLASFHFLYNSGEEQQQQHNVFLFNNTDPQQLKELSRNNNSYKRRRDWINIPSHRLTVGIKKKKGAIVQLLSYVGFSIYVV